MLQPSIARWAKLAFARAFVLAGQLTLGLLVFVLGFFVHVEKQGPGDASAEVHLCPSLPASPPARAGRQLQPRWEKFSIVPQTNSRKAICLPPRHGLVLYDL